MYCLLTKLLFTFNLKSIPAISAPLKSRVLLPGNGKPEAIPWYVAATLLGRS